MTNLDELAERIATQERAKKAIKILTAKRDAWTKKYILSVYEDQSLHDAYNTLRNSIKAAKEAHDLDSTRRLIVKYPNMIIYRFLDDYFAPKYGPEWASDRNTLKRVINNEDLIQPWVVDRASL